MARPKIPRKSTAVDMTAMCDVAFLLLSFFILTTKFKPSEAVQVTTPNSVASKIAPENDVVMISLTKDNKVFLSTGASIADREAKRTMLSELNSRRNLGLSESDLSALERASFLGVPLAQLSQQAKLKPEQMTGQALPGIMVDSANNELAEWMWAVRTAYQGRREPTILLKGDNIAKYPAFKNIITAFKREKFFKFQMVTNPESVPQGTDLFRFGRRED